MRRGAAGRLDGEDAVALGADDLTLLVIRPDGYVGLRADVDHLAALERYHDAVGNPSGQPVAPVRRVEMTRWVLGSDQAGPGWSSKLAEYGAPGVARA